MQKKIHFENLDALRFFSFLSVFLFHSFYTEFLYISNSPAYHFVKKGLFGNGNIGVNFFFVLSGFLITYLLIEEKKLNNQINIRKFWIRRILRIWPLYYFCVIFGFYAFPLIKHFFGQSPNETASIFYYLTFLNNFDFIKKGLPDASILGVLWSVAIEEQFYLIWPIILYILPVHKYWIAFTTIIIGSFIYRGMNDSAILHEHHTLSCIGDMAIGAFGAWCVSECSNFKLRIQKLKRFEIILIYILFLFVFLFRDEVMYSGFYIRIFERSILAVLALLIILEQNYAENSFFKLNNFKTITNLGTMTYGLYCLHFIGILVSINLTRLMHINQYFWIVMLVETFLALLITIIIAKISYKYYEKPFLNLKNRYSFITH